MSEDQSVKVRTQYDNMIAKVSSFKEEVLAIEISSDSDKDSAAATKKQLQKFKKETDWIRLMTTKPYRDFVKAVNDKWNEVVNMIKEVEAVVDGKILAYAKDLERKRKAREDKVNSFLNKINQCLSIEDIDWIISTLDIDDARINLFITQKKQQILDKIREEEEKRKIKEEEERIKKIEEEAKKKRDDADKAAADKAEKELEEERKKINEDRNSRKLEQRKKEQQEEKELEDAQKDLVTQKVIENQTKQSWKIKWQRKVLKFEVVDPSLVPVQYCTVDEKKIRAALSAKIVQNIPWVKSERVDKIW